jgi:hypothetical protein
VKHQDVCGAAADKHAYPGAHGRLDTALCQIGEARKASPAKGPATFVWFHVDGNLPSSTALKIDRHVSLKVLSRTDRQRDQSKAYS